MDTFNIERSMCRNCDCHHQYTIREVVDIPCVYCSHFGSGGCFEYIPSDNLEYLEYYAQIRRNIK